MMSDEVGHIIVHILNLTRYFMFFGACCLRHQYRRQLGHHHQRFRFHYFVLPEATTFVWLKRLFVLYLYIIISMAHAPETAVR